MKSIVLQYLEWQFFDVPKGVIGGWRNFLKFGLSYFSVPLLLKTLFSPWRRYAWSYGRGFDAKRFLEVFFSNLVSRFLGALMRSFLIIMGLFFELFILLAGAMVLLGWLFLPILIFVGLIFGFRILL